MQDYNKQYSDIKENVIKDLINKGDYLLVNPEFVKDEEWFDTMYELPFIRSINKYEQLDYFVVTKMINVNGKSVVFETINREDSSIRHFNVLDVALDELLDIHTNIFNN